MIEVLFSESEAASMMIAKQENFIAGKVNEIINFCFMLDIGDIYQDIQSQYRKDFICSMYFQGQSADLQMSAELKKTGDYYIGQYRTLIDYLKDGRSIRIWYSETPYSLCGFYYLCSLLEKYHNEVYTVKLDRHIVIDHTIYQCWNEVPANKFANFLSYQRKLTDVEIKMYSFLWQELVEDNSPLRAVINGQLIGVPEDFYDNLLWKYFSKKPIAQSRLIGMILNHFQIAVSDWWYAKRIDFYIEKGKIRIVKNSKNKYERIISL